MTNLAITEPGPMPYQQMILVALMMTGKHIYEGTANQKKVAKRRARNKMAKVSRRINRK